MHIPAEPLGSVFFCAKVTDKPGATAVVHGQEQGLVWFLESHGSVSVWSQALLHTVELLPPADEQGRRHNCVDSVAT